MFSIFDRLPSLIAVIKAQVTGDKNELPANYNGEEWRLKKVAEYYKAVSDAEHLDQQRECHEHD